MAMTPEGREFARAHIVEVFEDKGGKWRWRRKVRGNGATDSTSGESFASEGNADRAGREANPFMEVVHIHNAEDVPVTVEPDDTVTPITSTDVETKPRKPTTKKRTAKKPAARKRKTTTRKRT